MQKDLNKRTITVIVIRKQITNMRIPASIKIVVNAVVSEIWAERATAGKISHSRQELVNNLNEREYCNGNGERIVRLLVNKGILVKVGNVDCMPLTEQGKMFISGMIDVVQALKPFEGITVALGALRSMVERRTGDSYSQVGTILLEPVLPRVGIKVE